MLRYLADIPNVVTVAGLVLTATALHQIMQGHNSLAVVLLMWAVMADHLDGWLAKRATARQKVYARVGGNLDSLADLVTGAVAPSLVAMSLTGASVLSLASGVVLIVAGSLRLAYYNSFGLTEDGRFAGVPMTYTVPVTGMCFVVAHFVDRLPVSHTLPYVLIVMGLLHVGPIGPRPLKERGMLLVGAYAFALSALLLWP